MKINFSLKRFFASIIDACLILSIFYVLNELFLLLFPSTKIFLAFMSSMPSRNLHWFLYKAIFLIFMFGFYYGLMPLTKLQSTFGLASFGLKLTYTDNLHPIIRAFRRSFVITLKWALLILPGPLVALILRKIDLYFGLNTNDFGTVLTVSFAWLGIAVLLISHLITGKEDGKNIWDRLTGANIES